MFLQIPQEGLMETVLPKFWHDDNSLSVLLKKESWFEWFFWLSMKSSLPLHDIKQILCFLRFLGFLPFLSEPSLFHVSVVLSCSAFILLPAFPPQGGILSWKETLEDGFWKSTEAKLLHPFSHYPWTLFLKKKIVFNWRIIALQYCVGFYRPSTWITWGPFNSPTIEVGENPRSCNC